MGNNQTTSNVNITEEYILENDLYTSVNEIIKQHGDEIKLDLVKYLDEKNLLYKPTSDIDLLEILRIYYFGMDMKCYNVTLELSKTLYVGMLWPLLNRWNKKIDLLKQIYIHFNDKRDKLCAILVLAAAKAANFEFLTWLEREQICLYQEDENGNNTMDYLCISQTKYIGEVRETFLILKQYNVFKDKERERSDSYADRALKAEGEIANLEALKLLKNNNYRS